MIFLWLWTCLNVSRDVREIKAAILAVLNVCWKPLALVVLTSIFFGKLPRSFGRNSQGADCHGGSLQRCHLRRSFGRRTHQEPTVRWPQPCKANLMDSHPTYPTYPTYPTIPTRLSEARYILPLDSGQCHSRVCGISSNYACLLEALLWELGVP